MKRKRSLVVSSFFFGCHKARRSVNLRTKEAFTFAGFRVLEGNASTEEKEPRKIRLLRLDSQVSVGNPHSVQRFKYETSSKVGIYSSEGVHKKLSSFDSFDQFQVAD